MTCALCDCEDPLQVLRTDVCRSCAESLYEHGVDVEIWLVENMTVEVVPGTTFFYPRCVVSKLMDYRIPHSCALN